LPAKTVDFVYFDAGGGHRSAALALEAVIASGGYDWQVRLVNLQELLDSLDIFRKFTGLRMQEIYNLLLAKGWTLGSETMLKAMHLIIRTFHSAEVKMLREHWASTKPDMVVSLVPNFNRAQFQALRQSRPGVPFVTVLTDFADYPPHFWMERQSEQYFICGTQRAYQQAKEMGHPPERTFLTSGMILRPQFYDLAPIDRPAERAKLGLDPNIPTALVLFGGEGSNTMYSIAQRLGNANYDVQMVLICGHNKRLKQRLDKLQTRNRKLVEGFTKQIPYYMQVCDFFIGKPGPGSISEALKMDLPVIIERNMWTLPQERFNADWVRNEGVGVVLPVFRNIDRTVRELLQTGQLERMRAKIATMENRAVFEVPQILDGILKSRQ
jgi:1,2-diacylglycerol 3-beta-galactosyltransferase